MSYQTIKKLKDQVGFILREHPDTRNSDEQLVKAVCTVFGGNSVNKASRIERCRRHFNQLGFYLPTLEDVARKRKMNIDEWRVAMGYPTSVSVGTPKPSWTPPSEIGDEQSVMQRLL